VATLGPGGFFGEIAVLDEGERSATVRAETSLHCLVLPNGKLGDLVREHPQVGVNLLRALASRLRGMTARGQPARAEVGRG
jgi:CRP/FNR family transcriptional regulator, cyclic AMP receptor protein